MMGLYRRQLTGRGGAVSTSLLANGLWANGCFVQAALCGAEFLPRAPRYERSALLDLYRCRDGRWFMFSMVNHQREWPLLAKAIGRPQWQNDPRFATIEARQKNCRELTLLLEDILAEKDWPEWRGIFTEAGVTFGAVAAPEDHLDCPQVAANGLLPEFADAAGLRTVDTPIWVHGEVKRAPRMAPRVGEHTCAILSEFGLSQTEIAAMIESGAAAAE